MTSSALIIDGYVDEPACLGVAPYISPYVREVAGVLIEHGYVPGYVTIDQVRSDPALVAGRGDDLVVMIAGRTVPGTYIGGKPATLTEIQQLGLLLREPTTVIGGPITFGMHPAAGREPSGRRSPGSTSCSRGHRRSRLMPGSRAGNPPV